MAKTSAQGSTPWQGTDYIERRFNGVRNGLVGIYLDGVRGVSPDRGANTAWKMVSGADADRIIANARRFYAELVLQKAPRSAKSWHDHKVKELDDLIDKAVAVREGRREQKMTATDYKALLAHLQNR